MKYKKYYRRVKIMKRMNILLIFLLTISLLTFTTLAMGQNIKMTKQSKATITGTLKYASMKYWVETANGKTIDFLYDIEDQELDSKLGDLIGKKITLTGMIEYYSDGSKYFRITKSSMGSPSVKTNSFTTANENHAVVFGGKTVYQNDDCYSLAIEKVFSIGTDKVGLIGVSSGGTACPKTYVFITVKGSGAPLVSKEFGNCSDIPKIAAKGDKITLSFPGNPPEMWTYQAGNLRKGK